MVAKTKLLCIIKGYIMQGYDFVTLFLPFLSDYDDNEMKKFFVEHNITVDYYDSGYSGDYYIEFESDNHERDSSHDKVIVWKKSDDNLLS